MTIASGHTEDALRWERFSLVEQMANIGSEVERAISAREAGNESRANWHSTGHWLSSISLRQVSAGAVRGAARFFALARNSVASFLMRMCRRSRQRG